MVVAQDIIPRFDRLPMRVRAESSTRALAEIREALGDDAIILGTRAIRDPDTGVRLVEVEATLDAGSAPPMPRSLAAPTERRTIEAPAPKPLLRVPSSPSFAAPGGEDVAARMVELLEAMNGLKEEVRAHKAEATAAQTELRALRREMGDLENAVGALTSEHHLMRERGIPAEWVPAYRRLMSAMIDPQIAEEVLKDALGRGANTLADPAATHKALIAAVAERLKVKPVLGQAISPPALAVVGPAGAGKTSMVAKIAAQAVLTGGPSVGLVTYEGAGSFDALSKVAGALGVPLSAAKRDAGALARAVGLMHSERIELVVIDTPPARLGDTEKRNEAQWRELATIPGAETLLVLSAAMRDLDLVRASREIGRLGFNRFAFTHMDETMRTGGLLTAVVSSGRPIGALSYGGRIPDDLVFPDPYTLATSIMKPPRADLGTTRREG